MTHPVPCSESSLTLSRMHMPSVKTVIYVPSMTIFQNKSFLFYKSKSIGQSLISTCFYQVPCVFVGNEFSGSHRGLHMPSDTFANFHRWIHMFNQEYRVFHPSGYLSLLAILNTCIFHFLFFYATVRLILNVVPFYRAHHRNTKHRVNLPCTHDIPSNTKHNVYLYHALTPMSCDVPCINSMQCHCMYLMIHAQ